MSRENAIIEKIENQLLSEGYKRLKDRYELFGESKFGKEESFFDLMVNLRLSGEEGISAEEVFNDLRKEINSLTYIAANANDDYEKLHRKYRGLKYDYERLIRENNG